MTIDVSKQSDRIQLLKDIESTENKGRKYESLRQTEIFNDRIFDHVYERLIRRNNQQTVLEMPVVSTINLARRIAKQEASIYRNPPVRTFSNLSDDQLEVVNRIYDDMGINSKLLTSNEAFKYQNQNHVMVVPKSGKLIMRVLRNHHLDSIDDELDPERPIGYVVSQVDKNEVRRNRSQNKGGTGVTGRYDTWTDQEGDFRDQSIGDDDDFLKMRKKYLVWTKDFNFIMDAKGNPLSEDVESLISGVLPIVDISIEKDFEYWVRQGDSLAEFTVEYNSTLSDVAQVVRMQGYAQAYMVAKDDIIPENVQIGPNFLLKLPMEEGSAVRPEFGFANPGADVNGSIAFAETLVSNFLTSRGKDPTVVTGSGQVNKPGSGIERLLMMIDQFEASRSDFDTYERAEREVYRVIKAWHNAAIGKNLLDSKYQATQLPDDSEVSVQYAGPEMIKTENDKIDMWVKRIEAGEATVLDMTMDMRGLNEEEALEVIKKNEDMRRDLEVMLMGGVSGDRVTGQSSNEDADT